MDPNEILKTITIRDGDGAVVADMTVRGRDVTPVDANVYQRRCVVTTETKVQVQGRADYEITVDGETSTIQWPGEPQDHCYFSDCFREYGTVHFLARGVTESAEIGDLINYLRVAEISRMWNLSTVRVRQIIKRDDFPAPAKTVETRKLWLLEDLETWWFRDGRHPRILRPVTG